MPYNLVETAGIPDLPRVCADLIEVIGWALLGDLPVFLKARKSAG
jgi:hypothetical protein